MEGRADAPAGTERADAEDPSPRGPSRTLPSAPVIASPEVSVLDEAIPAPRRRRRFFSHSALGQGRRVSFAVGVGSIVYAALSGLRLGPDGLLMSLVMLGLLFTLPAATFYGLTSVLLGMRRRRLRREARTLLRAAEERLPEEDEDLRATRRLVEDLAGELLPRDMHLLEARLDYLADRVRASSRGLRPA